MPPALSDEESGSFEDGVTQPPRKSSSPVEVISDKNKGVEGDVRKYGEEEEDDDDDDDEEEEAHELADDVYIVESIKKHLVDEDGTLKFQVKWEGYERKQDLTWEPEENLQESAGDILEEYLESVGGREKIFENTKKAKREKKRGRPSTGPSSTSSKRSRQNGTHPLDSTPPATAKKWTPPAGSWEDDVHTIDACEDEGSGKLIVYLIWKNGEKTKHDTQVIYKKCPQKMLEFYERHVRIIRDESGRSIDDFDS